MTERDKKIIELTQRYRLGTNATFQAMAFDGQSLNAVSKVTARLCKQRLLARYPLFPPQDYFSLGTKATQMLGLPVSRSLPLGPQALPMDYAVLLYAASGERKRLMASELEESVSWLPGNLRHSPYCIGRENILELVRVDLGGSARNIAKKLSADCSKRLEISEFRSLIANSKFQLVVLTTTNAKARLIRQAIQSLTWAQGVRLHLAMIPNLTQLHFRKF